MVTLQSPFATEPARDYRCSISVGPIVPFQVVFVHSHGRLVVDCTHLLVRSLNVKANIVCHIGTFLVRLAIFILIVASYYILISSAILPRSS